MRMVAAGRVNDQGSAIEVREATVDDACAIAQVYIKTASAQYQTIVPGRLLERLTARHVAHRWELLLTTRRWARSVPVASSGSGLVGFAAAGPARGTSLGNAGEIYAIYVLPRWQRLGLGRLLFHRVKESLASVGLDPIVTWVIAANPSRRFFDSLGGTVVASTTSPSRLTKVAYVWGEWPDPWLPIPVREISTRQT